MTTQEPTTYERLSARFDAHHTRKQGGRDLTYITGEQVIRRLNEVLGVTGWSVQVIREGATDTEAWVLGEMTAWIDGKPVVRQQYGNQDLKRGQHPTADLYKAACTDMVKKCATTIGVGLYLYDEDERREVEQDMREAKRNPQPAATEPTPIRDAATLTGANPERGENVKKVQTVMRMALAENIKFEDCNPNTLSDEALQKFGKDLADKVRAARAKWQAS